MYAVINNDRYFGRVDSTEEIDKPRVPYLVKSNRSEDIEFGPVYQDDYAILTVTAFGSNEEELISGAKLLVSPDRPTWDGSINYKDPTKEDPVDHHRCRRQCFYGVYT